MADFFLDTNVLLYAVSNEPVEAAKTQTARALLLTLDWAWSAQVAAEFIRAGTAQRKPHPLTIADARQWVQQWMTFPQTPVDGRMVLEAAEVSERYQISQFDAQIVAAARRMSCATIYSEDLNDGQEYAGVRVINPFRTAP